MRRLAALAMLLLAAAVAAPARADDAGSSDCDPRSDLILRGAQPLLRVIGGGARKVDFVLNGSQRAGCPSPAPACAGDDHLDAGDAVVVTATHGDYACAAFTGRAPPAASAYGWLPRAALVAARPPRYADRKADYDWLGDWRAGPEQRIRIRHASSGHVALDGVATSGGDDPDKVRRGAVNTGDFSVIVRVAADHLAFLIGAKGKAMAYDARHAQGGTLCGLRLWRLGPYVVVADNLECGGANVTFTGVYRRVAPPP